MQAQSRQERPEPQFPHHVWSMDFLSDALFTGEKLRVLALVDAFTRLSPGIGVAFQYKACQVIQTLNQAVKLYSKPSIIRVDNGPEFISKELDLWAYAHKVTLGFSRPGKPTDNAYIESFNSHLRQECLNQNWFLSLEDAKDKIEDWWRDYNSHRPPSHLGYKTPEEFTALAYQPSEKKEPKKKGFSR